MRGQEPSTSLFSLPSDGSSKIQTLTIMPRFKRYKVAGQGLSGETEELIYKKNRILRNYLAWSWASQEPLLFMKRPRWSLATLIRKSDSTVLPCFLNQYIKLFNLKVTCYDLQPALSVLLGKSSHRLSCPLSLPSPKCRPLSFMSYTKNLTLMSFIFS